MRGYVYVMSNPGHGLIKIGCTSKNPHERAKQLSRETGVPYSYQCVYSAEVQDMYGYEKRVHNSLRQYRHNSRKEFFNCPAHIAIGTIRNFGGCPPGKNIWQRLKDWLYSPIF